MSIIKQHNVGWNSYCPNIIYIDNEQYYLHFQDNTFYPSKTEFNIDNYDIALGISDVETLSSSYTLNDSKCNPLEMISELTGSTNKNSKFTVCSDLHRVYTGIDFNTYIILDKNEPIILPEIKKSNDIHLMEMKADKTIEQGLFDINYTNESAYLNIIYDDGLIDNNVYFNARKYNEFVAPYNSKTNDSDIFATSDSVNNTSARVSSPYELNVWRRAGNYSDGYKMIPYNSNTKISPDCPSGIQLGFDVWSLYSNSSSFIAYMVKIDNCFYALNCNNNWTNAGPYFSNTPFKGQSSPYTYLYELGNIKIKEMDGLYTYMPEHRQSLNKSSYRKFGFWEETSRTESQITLGYYRSSEEEDAYALTLKKLDAIVIEQCINGMTVISNQGNDYIGGVEIFPFGQTIRPEFQLEQAYVSVDMQTYTYAF